MTTLRELAAERAAERAAAGPVEATDPAAAAAEYRDLVHEFGAGVDLVGRGWEDPGLVEVAAGWVAGGCASGVALVVGAAVVFVRPECVVTWVCGVVAVGVAQVAAAGVAAWAKYQRGLQWWAPVKEAGKVRLRVARAGGGLEVWASKGGKRQWVPSSEFAVISEHQGPGEEGQQE